MSEATLYLITYDISNDWRRTQFHKTLCGFCQWTQYSFFKCFLTDKELITPRHHLDAILKETEDNVRICHICHVCQVKTETISSAPRLKISYTYSSQRNQTLTCFFTCERFSTLLNSLDRSLC